MNGLTVPLRAMLKAAWRESYNQGWRFSRAKLGVWGVVLRLGLACPILWRLGSEPPFPAGGPVLLLAGLQAALLSFLTFLLRGRVRLYTGPWSPSSTSRLRRRRWWCWRSCCATCHPGSGRDSSLDWRSPRCSRLRLVSGAYPGSASPPWQAGCWAT